MVYVGLPSKTGFTNGYKYADLVAPSGVNMWPVEHVLMHSFLSTIPFLISGVTLLFKVKVQV